MSEIEKRSIVLTKDIAKKMDKYALNQHISFSSAIRFACEKLLSSVNPGEAGLVLDFSTEELSLLNKVSAGLQISKEDILKQCFELAIPQLVEKIVLKKQALSDLNKKL
jgi:hypothetical protein